MKRFLDFLARAIDLDIKAIAQFYGLLLGCGITVYIVLLSVYASQFGIPYVTGAFSHNQDDWGRFGAYVGGLAGPLLNLLSFSAGFLTLLIAIRSFHRSQANQRIEALFKMLLICNEDIIKRMPEGGNLFNRHIPVHRPQEPRPYNAEEFRAFQISNLYKLMYKWMVKIKELDPESPALAQFCEKHGSPVRKLYREGWIPGPVRDFFTEHDVASQIETDNLNINE